MSRDGSARSFPPDHFASFAEFSAKFTEQAANYIDALRLESDKKKIDAVFRQISRIFQVKH